MNAQEFTYWLQGYFELSNSETLTSNQVQIIKDHLNLVFNKATPDRNMVKKPIFPSNIFPQGGLLDCSMGKQKEPANIEYCSSIKNLNSNNSDLSEVLPHVNISC